MKPLSDASNTPNIPEGDAYPASFETVDNLIQYLESLGVDRSALFVHDGAVAFREKPMSNVSYTLPYNDKERGIGKGVIALTERGKAIIAEIKAGTFQPTPRPDLIPQDGNVPLKIWQDTVFKKPDSLPKPGQLGDPLRPFDPESGTDEAELLEDERKGTLRKTEKGYFLELTDGTLLPFSQIAFAELDEIGGGVDRHLGQIIEVRVDDSQSPPVVIEIYFEGE